VTLSPEKASANVGRVAGEGAGPAVAPWRAALRWFLVLAFVFRGALSLLEAFSMATGTLQPFAPVSSESLDSYSPFWPAMWGVLSMLTAGALALRIRTGWLVGVAVTVAYFVAGITNASVQTGVLGADTQSTFFRVVVGLIVPRAIHSGLISISAWYLPSGRPLTRLGRARLERSTPPTLDRWRRRN
jgi:hypothetical protein